ncbi:MAG: NADH-quinone oxidoreductase subunit N [Alphaproteobacteria bacterium]|nr:NADH-quinone oxidoreductase subunit N [Alphaproteobacteria bacterium]NCQ66691.1 NADH-quinone oxidoreductase subunit N [Alphaproteobacteria bacterium]NCT07142.1 NADH-quinone oxidoreductase subunit N [Alphaproteobacteria bacterium]
MTPNLLPEFIHGMPEVFLIMWALVVLMVGVFQKRSEREGVYYITFVGIGLALFMLYSSFGNYAYSFNEMFKVTPFTQLMKGVVLLAVGAVFYMTFKHFPREQMNRFEYPVLVLISTVGMMIMISANDLISAFLGIEMQSLCLYIMVSIARDRPASGEAGIKYFVLGALATAFFLFGSGYLYGFTGTTEFNGMAAVLANTSELPVPVGIAFMMILVAVGFKVSLAPFHMWTPDVYEGAPTPVTAFLAAAPKIAGFVLLLNFVATVFASQASLWTPVLSALAILSILVGAFAALFQRKLKRILAYSSISHMGFALLGFLSLNAQGFENIFNYLIIYVIMTIGAFAALLTLRKRGQLLENIEDLTGLSKDAPLIALCMTVLLFSLAGVPPFAGFFAKLFVIQNAVSGNHYLAVILAVLGSVVSAGYYLRVIKAMYFDEPVGGEHTMAVDKTVPIQTKLVLVLSTFLVTFYVIMPHLFTLEIGVYLR